MTERIKNLKQQIYDALPEFPMVTGFAEWEHQFAESNSFTHNELDQAINELLNEGKINLTEQNGYKIIYRLSSFAIRFNKIWDNLTEDDIDWLGGVGRYSQN